MKYYKWLIFFSQIFWGEGLDYCTLESRQVTKMIQALKGRLDALTQDVEGRGPEERRGVGALIVLAGGEAKGMVQERAAAGNEGDAHKEVVAEATRAVREKEVANYKPVDTPPAPPQAPADREATYVICFRNSFHQTEASVRHPIT